MSLPRLDYDPRASGERAAFPPIEWVPALGCWCVFALDDIAYILKSHMFAAADFIDWHQKLQQKVGIDCSAIINVLGHIATANEGERHAHIRRDVARVLKSNLASTKEKTAKAANQIVNAACRPGWDVDLILHIVRPICDIMFEGILGVGAVSRSDVGVSPSQIFDLYLGLNSTKEDQCRSFCDAARFHISQR